MRVISFFFLIVSFSVFGQEFKPIGKNVYIQEDSDCWSFISRVRPIGESAGIVLYEKNKTNNQCSIKPVYVGFIHTAVDVVNKTESETPTFNLCKKEIGKSSNLTFSYYDNFCFISKKSSSSTTEQVMWAVKEKEGKDFDTLKYYYISFQVKNGKESDYLEFRKNLLKRIKVPI